MIVSDIGKDLLIQAESLKKDFQAYGRSIDYEQRFPREIATLFKGEYTSQLMSSHSEQGVLDSDEECQFYYLTTKYCANIRNYFLVSVGMVGSTIQKYGTDQQRANFGKRISFSGAIASLAITEPNVGSNINEISTRYEIKDEKFILTGKKRWITLGGIADILMVVANGERGLLAFLFDSSHPGVKRAEMKDLLSNRGSHISELSFENISLTQDDLVGGNEDVSAKSVGFALMNGRAIASIAAVGMASAALEEMISYSKSRKQFGVRIWEHQLVQKLIGDAQTKIHAGLALSKEAFRRKHINDVDANHYCAVSKLFSSQAIEEISSDAIQLLGGNGLTSNFNAERYFREAKAFQFIEGTSQILVQVVARGSLMGVPKLWPK